LVPDDGEGDADAEEGSASGGGGGGSGTHNRKHGWIVHHATIYSVLEGRAPTSDRWVCTNHPAHSYTKEDLEAMTLPEGSPASSYYTLLDYAEQLGTGINSAPDDVIAGSEVLEAVTALTLAVGTNHWAAQQLNIRVLSSLTETGGAGAWGVPYVESCTVAVLNWIEGWLRLEPALFLGPVTLLRTAAVLIAAEKIELAVRLWQLVQAGTPPQSQVFRVAGDMLAQCGVEPR
jgi:hypothetical protein